MRNVIKQLLKDSAGRIFTVRFRKVDGSLRTLNGRLGVHCKTGKPSSTAHIPKYLTVFDMQKRSFRTVNLDTVDRVRTSGLEVMVRKV